MAFLGEFLGLNRLFGIHIGILLKVCSLDPFEGFKSHQTGRSKPGWQVLVEFHDGACSLKGKNAKRGLLCQCGEVNPLKLKPLPGPDLLLLKE